MLSPAPAAMQSWAAALAPGSSSLPSLAPGKMPATSASRSARLPATSRSSVAAAAISGSVGLRQRACRLATPSRRATSRRSGAGPGPSGHQAIRPSLEHVSDKCKLARLVFRPRTCRKDRRGSSHARVAGQSAATGGSDRRRAVLALSGLAAAWSVVVSPETPRRLPAPQLQNRLLQPRSERTRSNAQPARLSLSARTQSTQRASPPSVPRLPARRCTASGARRNSSLTPQPATTVALPT